MLSYGVFDRTAIGIRMLVRQKYGQVWEVASPVFELRAAWACDTHGIFPSNALNHDGLFSKISLPSCIRQVARRGWQGSAVLCHATSGCAGIIPTGSSPAP